MPIGPDNSVYTVAPCNDGTYVVEILGSGQPLRNEVGFKTREEADLWIFQQVERTHSDPAPYAGPQDSLPGFPGSKG